MPRGLDAVDPSLAEGVLEEGRAVLDGPRAVASAPPVDAVRRSEEMEL